MIIPNPYFKNIPFIGDLVMDYIIFDAGYPLLFICKTKQNSFYLCNCCDIYKEQRWLLAPITIDGICELLNNKITIRNAFKKAIGVCCVATWFTGDLYEKYVLISSSEFDAVDLPEAGEFVDSEINEHDDYLRKIQFEAQCIKRQDQGWYLSIKSPIMSDSVQVSNPIYHSQKELTLPQVVTKQINGVFDGNTLNCNNKRSCYGMLDYNHTIDAKNKYFAFAA